MNADVVLTRILDFIDTNAGTELPKEEWIEVLEQLQSACHARLEMAKCPMEETD